MPKKVYVEELVQDAFVQSIFLATQKTLRQTKHGEEYLCVTLTDRTGSVEARAWEDAQMLSSRFEAGDHIAVRAVAVAYQSTTQLRLMDLERLSPKEVNSADFLPSSRWQAEALFAQLKDLILSQVASPSMRQFFKALFGQEALMAQLKRAPAATSNHHQYLSGLVEHILSMTRSAVGLADHYGRYYPGLINKDLLMAGCLLHDLGKCQELAFKTNFEYTTEGRLVGHIVHGVEIINHTATLMNPSPPEDMLLQLKHLVLSHHGRLEYGSPVKPQTPEAILLHQIDMIDSRMNMCWQVAQPVLHQESGQRWTEHHRALEGRLYLGDASQEPAWRADPILPLERLDGPGSISDHATALNDDPEEVKKAHDAAPLNRHGRPSTLNLFGD